MSLKLLAQSEIFMNAIWDLLEDIIYQGSYYYIELVEKLNVGSNLFQTARDINESMVNKIVKIIIDEKIEKRKY